MAGNAFARGGTTNVKGLTLEGEIGEIVENLSVSLSPTLSKNEKVEHHVRIETHKLITLRFWIKDGENLLCVGWEHVSLMLYLLS